MKDVTEQLKKILFDSVKVNSTSSLPHPFLLRRTSSKQKGRGLLFSGGLDSAILAYLGTIINSGCARKSVFKAITISLNSYGEDAKFAKSIAEFLNIEHYHRSVNINEVIDAIPEVIKILKSFDPAIPNDLVVYFGLKTAKKLGIDEVMTGDGTDELFAGYNFMQKIDDLEGYIKRISQNMRFSSNLIGDFFGIKIVQPFLNKEIVEFALSIRPGFKLKRENGKFWGKWILRKAFEQALPKEVIWQSKRALEIGSGMTKIREIISGRITDTEFKKNSHPVTLINKEHFYYYKVYKDIVGDIPKANRKEKECLGCGAGMHPSAFHCEVCGYTTDWRT